MKKVQKMSKISCSKKNSEGKGYRSVKKKSTNTALRVYAFCYVVVSSRGQCPHHLVTGGRTRRGGLFS